MRRIFDIWKCRILYGHVMVPFGNEYSKEFPLSRNWVYYMCARCTLCQRLNFIGRDEEAE